jgi:hypothetical protein
MRTGILLILGGVVLLVTGFWLISKDKTEEPVESEPVVSEAKPVKDQPVKEKPHYEDAVVVYSKSEEEYETANV